MVQVYSAQHPTEAYIVKMFLESYGISCEVQGEYLRGTKIPLALVAPSVWIFDDSRYDEARIIIKEYENARLQKSSDKETWICKFCGEESGGQFTDCWNCGKPRVGEVKV